jgi:ATP/maltotriose-dependent transcriptional regulator MalT
MREPRLRCVLERVIASSEKALGPEHKRTLFCLTRLADLLFSEGDLAGARSLCERIIQLYHPSDAASYVTGTAINVDGDRSPVV